MHIQRATPINELLAKIIFLILPSLLVVYFLLWNANHYYSVLRTQHTMQTIYVGIAALAAALFYSFRFRFLPTFAALVIVFYLVYKGIDATATGEFDSFFVSIQVLVFSILFTLGWLIGWGFVRLKYFAVVIATLFLIGCILLIAKQNSLLEASSSEQLLLRWSAIFGPVALFAVYIIYAAGLIRSYKDKSQNFWWMLSRRLVLFLLLAVLILGGTIFFLRTNIKATLAEYGGGSNGEGKNSLLKKNKDGTFDLEEYTRLRGNLGRSKELLFAAHIDNFFPNSETPNPLYLTAFYYSKFDTATETFERDSLIPANDLFNPDMTKVPLYFTQKDSSVLKYALTEKFRRTVEIEVYKRALSPATFVAPSTSFFVQPIAIEKDFQSEFKTAYRAKSYISELNSAYFIYNVDDPVIRAFQEQRFEVLRNVKNYADVNNDLMKYYTFMPSDAKFNQIKNLALQVTQGKNTPVDRVIAIRDYFLSKDENGEPLFKYTDNPGIPDIPSASKLQYFLFENRKGYCAYYAGATLFMLRSLGIPSRITVGFLTEERDSKTPGWYWYYADQAHAWVQVYFPGYGWLDFDTTVGNDDARESPQPDGTPPMQPPKAYLAADGVITAFDTANKKATLRTGRMVFHDQEYMLPQPEQIQMDMGIAKIFADSTQIGIKDLKIGDSATAISFADAIKNMSEKSGESGTELTKRLPTPTPIDELHLKRKKENDTKNNAQKNQDDKPTNWKKIGWISLAVFSLLLLTFIFLPRIIFAIYKYRSNTSKSIAQKAYWSYRTASFWLHSMGFPRGSQTALQHAQKTDAQFGTQYAQFMIPYLKLKYAKQPFNAEDEKILSSFLPQFLNKAKQHIPFKTRFKRWFRVLRSFVFFGVSED